MEEHKCSRINCTYKGIREVEGHQMEIWECPFCGEILYSPYSGAIDTVEGYYDI